VIGGECAAGSLASWAIGSSSATTCDANAKTDYYELYSPSTGTWTLGTSAGFDPGKCAGVGRASVARPFVAGKHRCRLERGRHRRIWTARAAGDKAPEGVSRSTETKMNNTAGNTTSRDSRRLSSASAKFERSDAKLSRRGAKRALIVTGKTLGRSKLLDKVKSAGRFRAGGSVRGRSTACAVADGDGSCRRGASRRRRFDGEFRRRQSDRHREKCGVAV